MSLAVGLHQGSGILDHRVQKRVDTQHRHTTGALLQKLPLIAAQQRHNGLCQQTQSYGTGQCQQTCDPGRGFFRSFHCPVVQ